MLDLLAPLLFAVFIWWFSTGLVLLLDGLPRTTFRWSVLISSGLAIGAFFGLAHTANQASGMAAYCSFTCALLVWGWHELTFLTGWLTGPRKQASAPDCSRRDRFFQAIAAILWHELAIAASGLLIIAITWNAPNQVGTWTFAVLWVMRTSAKLNLFLGVRNLSEEFLPSHLAYLESFFKRRRMNAFFPFAVVSASACLWFIVDFANHAMTTPAQLVGAVLVGTMLALAIVEHLMLVLPLDTTAMWRWAVRKHPPETPTSFEAQVPQVLPPHLDSHDKSLQVN